MSIPLLSILLLIIFTTIRFKYDFVILSFFVFFVSSVLIIFLRPSFDDQHFIEAALRYNLSEALSDTTIAVSPVSPLINLVSRFLTVDVRSAVLIINSVLISAIVLTAKTIFLPQLCTQRRMNIIIPFVSLLMFFPSTSIILITANKDLCIIYSLVCFFSAVFTPINRSNRYLKSISQVLQISLSLLVLIQLRQYFAWYLALSYAALVQLRVLQKLRFQRLLAISTVCLFLYLVLSAIIFFEWNDIRSMVETYYGAATVWPLYSIEAPNVIIAPIYPLLSILSIVFYPFGLAFTNPSVSVFNTIVGFYEGATFLTLSAITLTRISTQKISIFAILLFFVLIHFTIQPLGSPNVGSLFRLRLFEIFILIGSLSLKTNTILSEYNK